MDVSGTGDVVPKTVSAWNAISEVISSALSLNKTMIKRREPPREWFAPAGVSLSSESLCSRTYIMLNTPKVLFDVMDDAVHTENAAMGRASSQVLGVLFHLSFFPTPILLRSHLRCPCADGSDSGDISCSPTLTSPAFTTCVSLPILRLNHTPITRTTHTTTLHMKQTVLVLWAMNPASEACRTFQCMMLRIYLSIPRGTAKGLSKKTLVEELSDWHGETAVCQPHF